MRIKSISVNKFKRFTELMVQVPEKARLIILAGPNGSGKSSLIEAVYYYYRLISGNHGFDASYHVKQSEENVPGWPDLVKVEFYGGTPENMQEKRKAIYVRSAYRNEPEFEVQSLSKVGPAIDSQRFGRMIDNDVSVSQNYHRLVSKGIEDLYDPSNGNLTFEKYVQDSIGTLRKSISTLFPHLNLGSLSNPLLQGTFRFTKGSSNNFLYKNLSGGEKAAFDLLLDILVKKDEYDDTAFFIDEPEAHVAAGLQAPLLQEIFDLIPQNGQLWISTHSIGMMRKARDLSHLKPGEVIFFDFDGVNFDLPVTLTPASPDRPFWKRAMQIALDDIAGYVAPDGIVLCEGGGVVDGSKFDSDCYNEIFKAEHPQVVFLGAGNSDDVQRDPKGIERLLSALTPGVTVKRLLDRDDRTDEEIVEFRKKGIAVLRHRMIESYLLADEILTLLCKELGSPDSAPELLAAKKKAIQNSIANGGPADDMKRPAGDIYNAAKGLFKNVKLGGDKRAFMKGMCARLITPGTETYEQLHEDIFLQ